MVCGSLEDVVGDSTNLVGSEEDKVVWELHEEEEEEVDRDCARKWF